MHTDCAPRFADVHSGGSRISQLPGGGRQHKILPNFPKNCMKSKEFGLPGGGRPLRPLNPPLVRVTKMHLKNSHGNIQMKQEISSQEVCAFCRTSYLIRLERDGIFTFLYISHLQCVTNIIPDWLLNVAEHKMPLLLLLRR